MNQPQKLDEIEPCMPTTKSRKMSHIRLAITLAVAMIFVRPLDLRAQAGDASYLERIRTAITRDFGGIFVVNPNLWPNGRVNPVYAIGDFNGDRKSDLGVMVSVDIGKLAERLALDPNWSIPHLLFYPLDSPDTSDEGPKPFELPLKLIVSQKIERSALLILHDFSLDRRKPNAMAHAVTDFYPFSSLTMAVSRKRLPANSAGDSPVLPPPRIVGDMLLFLDRRSDGSAVYWDRGRYRWYPVGNR